MDGEIVFELCKIPPPPLARKSLVIISIRACNLPFSRDRDSIFDTNSLIYSVNSDVVVSTFFESGIVGVY